MSSAELGQIAVNAFLLSGILALVALGFSLVWGIMNIVNLSHGAFIVVGAYLTFGLHEIASIRSCRSRSPWRCSSASATSSR